jgi:hypothetical protein
MQDRRKISQEIRKESSNRTMPSMERGLSPFPRTEEARKSNRIHSSSSRHSAILGYPKSRLGLSFFDRMKAKPWRRNCAVILIERVGFDVVNQNKKNPTDFAIAAKILCLVQAKRSGLRWAKK